MVSTQRGVRYPGLISYKTPLGGGTTDYAVEIYFVAIRYKKYCCYVKRGWEQHYDLESMTRDMLDNISKMRQQETT